LIGGGRGGELSKIENPNGRESISREPILGGSKEKEKKPPTWSVSLLVKKKKRGLERTQKKKGMVSSV